jgi:hypothetical protein
VVVVAVVAAAFVVAWHILDRDRDRVVDRDDTDIEDFEAVVGIAKHAEHMDKTMVMAWVDTMVSVVANRQAF